MSYNTQPFLQQRCIHHPSEIMNMICVTTLCRNQGLICKQCTTELHEGHRIVYGHEFIDSLIKLIKWNGSEKVVTPIDGLAAKTTSAIITLIKELNSITEFLTQKLESLRLQFEKYREITQDINVINDFLTKPDLNLFQEVLKRICIRQQIVQLTAFHENLVLFLPDERLQEEFLDLLVQKFRTIRVQAELDIMKPSLYNRLDFKTGILQLQPNSQLDPIVFEVEQSKEEEKLLEKQIEQCDYNPVRLVKKQKPKEEQGEDESYQYGIGRVEKVFSVAGHKVWFHDFTYPRFKPKNWIIEPRNACIICKCHPKFARIKEFLNCKYGDLYGPVHLESNLSAGFKHAIANRKNKSYLIDKIGIYFHDLCVYWSTLVDCDEQKGTIDFESFHQAIKAAQETCCYLCKRRGATLKCNHQDCEIWIHYYCWKELEPAQQYLDTQRFRMLCYRHVPVKYETPAWVCQNSFLDEQKEFRRELRQYCYQTSKSELTYSDFMRLKISQNVKE